MIFSSTSFAEWTEVTQNVSGVKHYVDFERIRKVDGYIYYWILEDYGKPDKDGVFSEKLYVQGDCKLFRVMYLSSSFYKEPMGGGSTLNFNVTNLQKWNYLPPDSVGEVVLETVCSR